MNNEILSKTLKNFKKKINKVNSINNLEKIKKEIIGKNGIINKFIKSLKTKSIQEKTVLGPKINTIKKLIENSYYKTYQKLQKTLFYEKLKKNNNENLYDYTLPINIEGYNVGIQHPITFIKNKIIAFFTDIGFHEMIGPEIESEWFCFDALNTPKFHPSRDEKDTFYLSKNINNIAYITKNNNEKYLLRTHTSSVQIRTLLQKKPPLKIISCGKVFRKDNVDSTHNFNFHQLEGLVVQEKSNFLELYTILKMFLKFIFGHNTKIRLRPSYFPFTTPSFEIDIYYPYEGKLKNQWIEVLGCGMVHKNVFKSVNISNHKWNGFAFGLGIERLAMIYYQIDDIRHFYKNDLRFLKQFI